MIVKLSGHSIKTLCNHKVTVDELGTSKDPNPSIESTDGFNLTEISKPCQPPPCFQDRSSILHELKTGGGGGGVRMKDIISIRLM